MYQAIVSQLCDIFSKVMTILGTEEGDQDIMVNLSHCAHEHAKAIHASYLL